MRKTWQNVRRLNSFTALFAAATVCLVALVMLLAWPQSGNSQIIAGYQNGSQNVPSTGAVQIFAARQNRARIKVLNYHATVNVWCRWNATPTVAGLGSFRLAAGGGGIDDNGPGVNQSALNCLADTGGPAPVYAEQY